LNYKKMRIDIRCTKNTARTASAASIQRYPKVGRILKITKTANTDLQETTGVRAITQFDRLISSHSGKLHQEAHVNGSGCCCEGIHDARIKRAPGSSEPPFMAALKPASSAVGTAPPGVATVISNPAAVNASCGTASSSGQYPQGCRVPSARVQWSEPLTAMSTRVMGATVGTPDGFDAEFRWNAMPLDRSRACVAEWVTGQQEAAIPTHGIPPVALAQSPATTFPKARVPAVEVAA